MMLAFRPGFTFVLVALWLMLLAAQNQQTAGKPIGCRTTTLPQRTRSSASIRQCPADVSMIAAVDLSSVKPNDGPFAGVYKSFHYLSLPNPRDLTCTVLKALGDKFDFLAYY